MANISIGGRLSLLQRVASLDLRYGPYSSIADAYDNMGPSGDEVITAGLPFGVTEDDGSVSVYIWTKGEDATQTDCRKLDKEHIVLFNGFIDISVSIKQQRYNDVATKDNIVFLNDRKQFAYRDGLNFYINWKNRYVWSNENLIPYDDVIYIDINYNKAYYYNGTTLTLLASETFVSSINNQAPDENGNVNLTKEHIGLEKVDNTSDTEKVVKGANEDGSGNNIAATYETKIDATTKNTALQNAISALQTSVGNLTGLDSTNFGGFSIQSTEADAISNIATIYTADGYTNELLWYMAGTSLSSVKAYRYNGSGTPTLISNDSYDCVDFSGLITDVAALGQKIDSLDFELNGVSSLSIYNGFLDSSNKVVSYGQAKYIVIEVTGGETFKMALSHASNIFILSDFTYNPTLPYVITLATGETGRRSDSRYNLTLPSDASYVLVQVVASNGTETEITSLKVGEKDILHSQDEKITNVNTAATTVGDNLGQSAKRIGGPELLRNSGYYITTTGTVDTNSGYSTSDLYKVLKGESVSVSGMKNGTGALMMAVYDEDQMPLDLWQPSENLTMETHTYTAQKDCYVRFCGRNDRLYSHLAVFTGIGVAATGKTSSQTCELSIHTIKSEIGYEYKTVDLTSLEYDYGSFPSSGTEYEGTGTTMTKHIYLPVSSGDIVQVTTGTNATRFAWVSDKGAAGLSISLVTGVIFGYDGSLTVYEIAAPNGAKYLSIQTINGYGTDTTPALVKIRAGGVPASKLDVKAGVNIFSAQIIDNQWFNSISTIQSNSSYCITSPQKVKPSTTYSCSVEMGTIREIIFLDIDQKSLSWINSATATFTTPSDCCYVLLCIAKSVKSYIMLCESATPLAYAPYNPIEGHITPYIAPLQQSLDAIKNNISSTPRKVVWLGTSIPNGCPYPQNACSRLGWTCYNKAIGSSGIIVTDTWGGNTGRDGKDLAETISEKETRYRQYVTSGDISEATLTAYKGYSYETLLIPYIDGTIDACDTVVIDHGYNDRRFVDGNNQVYGGIVTEIDGLANADFSTDKDDDDFDRSTYVGAFCYLVKKIWEVNPNIRIVVYGHYEKITTSSWLWSNKCGQEIFTMHKALADHFGFPLLDCASLSGFNFERIPNSDDYISDFNDTYGTSWTVRKYNGYTGDNITKFQYYCPDGLHPHTDLTLRARQRLTDVAVKLLRDI